MENKTSLVFGTSKVCAVVAWSIFFLLICLYLHFLIKWPLDPFLMTFRLWMKFLLIALSCNFGVVFLFSGMAVKFKKLAILFYLPSFIVTPVVMGLYFIPGFFVIIVLNIFLLIKFNPWKRDEKKSVFVEK